MDDFAKALECVFEGQATILNRMRLACTFYNRDLAKKGNDGDGIAGLSYLWCLYSSQLVRLAGDERDCPPSRFEPSPQHY